MSAIIALVTRTQHAMTGRIWPRDANASSVLKDSLSFGPQYADKDDFTLYFEQNIFVVFPSSVAILSSLIYVWQATRKGPCIHVNWLFFAKTVPWPTIS